MESNHPSGGLHRPAGFEDLGFLSTQSACAHAVVPPDAGLSASRVPTPSVRRVLLAGMPVDPERGYASAPDGRDYIGE
ncbi:MAG: hypothetical protein QOJ29_3850 [Thermoleophilaceae bacterium]|nr:hypothetical protein [Thermoleophilaceae bacterium]